MLELARTQPVAHSLLVLTFVVVLGLSLGAIRVRGIGLDVAGVLFGGIVIGHFGAALDPTVLAFTRDLGLILFVSGIGMQVGPGFIDSLRADGMALNGMAAAIVVLGALVAVGLGYAFHLDRAVIAGIFAGATTNTPALGAAQEALRALPGGDATRLALPALGYAAAYPFGILGIIGSILLLRLLFGMRLPEEQRPPQSEPNQPSAAVHDGPPVASISVRSESAVVTRTALIGKTLQETGLRERFGVSVSRVHRSGVDLTEIPDVRLRFGDVLQIVGDRAATAATSEFIGNSVRDVSHTNFLPIFVGIALGIVLGTTPIPVPGIPVPLRLGLAGGPLLCAILLSRIGKVGPLVWYVPPSANAALRGLGIVLFLACVGLKAGEHFIGSIVHGDGLVWMATGVAVTAVPLLLVGAAARLFLRANFSSITGLLAGSMTDPPALAFATSLSGSDAPAIAYTSVYPLTMLLRIVAAQIIVMPFFQ
jgi:AspT/YidE/YbjL antiporter-like protein